MLGWFDSCRWVIKGGGYTGCSATKKKNIVVKEKQNGEGFEKKKIQVKIGIEYVVVAQKLGISSPLASSSTYQKSAVVKHGINTTAIPLRERFEFGLDRGEVLYVLLGDLGLFLLADLCAGDFCLGLYLCLLLVDGVCGTSGLVCVDEGERGGGAAEEEGEPWEDCRESYYKKL